MLRLEILCKVVEIFDHVHITRLKYIIYKSRFSLSI